MREDSELNQIDKPNLLLQYLDNHSEVWKNDLKDPNKHELIDILISSLVLERFLLDAKAGSSQLKVNFLKKIEDFYSDKDFDFFGFYQFYDKVLDQSTKELI